MGKLTQRCPSGHTIPHITSAGRCTPVRCAITTNKTATKHVKKLEAKRKIRNERTTMTLRRQKVEETATKELVREAKRTPLSLPDGASEPLAKEGRLESLTGLSIAAGRHHARMAFVQDLPDVNADEVTINNWSDRRLHQLLPLAIAHQELRLKYGDDDQQDKAAEIVLRANGRANKEQQLSGGALIVLHTEGPRAGSMTLPYLPKQLRPTNVIDVEAEVVDEKK